MDTPYLPAFFFFFPFFFLLAFSISRLFRRCGGKWLGSVCFSCAPLGVQIEISWNCGVSTANGPHDCANKDIARTRFRSFIYAFERGQKTALMALMQRPHIQIYIHLQHCGVIGVHTFWDLTIRHATKNAVSPNCDWWHPQMHMCANLRVHLHAHTHSLIA